jgi:RNA polymerase sigma factor (sigma-70 family)
MTEKQKRFANKNVWLMYSFIRDKTSEGVIPHYLTDDFISDMALRYCSSAIKFDEGRGFKFSTYAYGGFNMCCENIKRRKSPSYHKNHFRPRHVVERIIDSVPADSEKHVEEDALCNVIKKAKLNEREMIILKGYYFDGLSMAKVGCIVGLSKERISQILKKIVGKLKRITKSEKLSLLDFYEI